MTPIKDLPPPLLMGSTTRTSESPQLLFCRLSVAFKAATSLAVRDIPAFPLHAYFPITPSVNPITFPITYLQNFLTFSGTNQDHLNAEKSHPHWRMGLQKTSWEVVSTERVGVHIGPKTTARDGMRLTFRAKKLFPLHFPLHNYKTSWDFKRRPLRDLLASVLGVSFLHSQQQGS